jgi:hypothetical protein
MFAYLTSTIAQSEAKPGETKNFIGKVEKVSKILAIS